MGNILMEAREILLSLISLELDDNACADNMNHVQTNASMQHRKIGEISDDFTPSTPVEDSLERYQQSQEHSSKPLLKFQLGLRRCASTGAIYPSKETLKKEDIKKYFTQPQKRRQTSISPTCTQAK